MQNKPEQSCCVIPLSVCFLLLSQQNLLLGLKELLFTAELKDT